MENGFKQEQKPGKTGASLMAERLQVVQNLLRILRQHKSNVNLTSVMCELSDLSRTDLHWTPISLPEKWKVRRMILLVIKPPHPLPRGRSQLPFAMAIPGPERARGPESKRPCLRGHGLPPASSLPQAVLSWQAAAPLSAHGCQEPSFRLCGNAPRSPAPSRPVLVDQQLRRGYVVDSRNLFGNIGSGRG